MSFECALQKILRDAPERVRDLSSHATKIAEKLRGKGLRPPQYVFNLLSGMQQNAAQNIASAT